MVKDILTSNGLRTLVDDIDFEYLNQYSWHAKKDKSIKRENYYVQCSYIIRKKLGTGRMHRIIMSRILEEKKNMIKVNEFLKNPDKYFIDHIDGNGLNNRRSNLRIVSPRENQQNRHHNKTSKYPGVSWNIIAKKWLCRIQINGQRVHLGLFEDEMEAYQTYLKACELIENNEINKIESIIKHPKLTSKYRGVNWSKRTKKWVARVYRDKITYYLGYFEDEEEANFACKVAHRILEEGNEISIPQRQPTSKYLGIGYDKYSEKWRAKYQKNGIYYNVGLFKTEKEAHNAIIKHKRENNHEQYQ